MIQTVKPINFLMLGVCAQFLLKQFFLVSLTERLILYFSNIFALVSNGVSILIFQHSIVFL